MLDHISLGVCNVDHAKAFYDAVLAPLGYVRVWSTVESAGYGPPGAENEPFAIRVATGSITPPLALHIAFAAPSRGAVLEFHAAAIARGARDDGAPAIHCEYGANYFAAFIIDPDGYRIEAVHHETQTKLLDAADDDFASMLSGERPQGLLVPPDIDREIVTHVRRTVSRLRAQGCNSSWIIVSGDEVVGLCGFKTPPRANTVEIGYNVWPSRQRLGHASRAVAAMLRHAKTNPTIYTVAAETTTDNIASHHVLETNNFERTGMRYDAEDGDLIIWKTSIT